MILDDGICTVFSEVDVSRPGGMPAMQLMEKTQSWFGYLDFATVQAWPTDNREEIQADARIRVDQDRKITNKDVVILQECHLIEDDMERFEVIRAYHGHDDDNGQPITDLTLRRVSA